jgi:tetratricopeptide (TPR) repeat protein
MKFTFGLALAVTLALSPMARAQLDHPHRVLGRGVAAVVDGDFKKAEPLLRESLQLNPDMPEGHYNLAVVLRATGRYEEAVDQYRVAMDLFKKYGAADGENAVSRSLYGIALAEESRGDPQNASAAWSDYLRWAKRFKQEHPAEEIAQRHLLINRRELEARRRTNIQ